MKVLLINGSPHEHGCTRAALDEVARTLSECGVETELINLGAGPFSGCRACGGCAKTGRAAGIEPPTAELDKRTNFIR